MRPIKLPQPPSGFSGLPDFFQGGVSSAIRRAVVIGNGFAGSENQSIGLVRAIGLFGRLALYRVTRPRGGINEWLHWLPVSLHKKLYFFMQRIRGELGLQATFKKQKVMALSSETCGLSNILEADAKHISKMARETFEKEGPLLVVASGRDTISVASSIKRLAPENVFVVQIQHPRSHLNRFDMVITPRHDYYPLTPHAQEQIPWFLRQWITPREPPGKNVVLTVGALHQADSAALRSAASAWHDELAPVPKPLLVVNVGGPTKNCPYGADLANHLAARLQNVLWSCGTVRISFSRRTPEKVSNILVREFTSNPKVFIWDDGKGSNPHMGHLAWADAFVITADSVSMLSEACSTGKPVYVVGAERCTWKFSDFQKSLQDRGAVRPFTGKEDISDNWSYPPLNDNIEAARCVNTSLAERGWSIHT
ncbi:mitochondrial fission protein ELM1-like isoform X1 [Carya illinoinensis]|uniref:Mitochondrial fission protein ELM1 n=1 Tax=Carya illinoinensis TaxID=32201 RepID=A0A8T1PJF7_CARIL|nr:mitochondrial fission protein ELM1-like isoform X1 [Carya illinoinensis]KAG6640630.1 hypothetical protein CIPAW_09G017300 [Carya illinoinensis]KAG6693764.1 hypothetical protein I3842_09G017000 [Carya illinoinensis]